MRISDDDLAADWKTIEMIFFDGHNLVLWLVPLALAILLRVITSRYHHQLIFPMCKHSCCALNRRDRICLFQI